MKAFIILIMLSPISFSQTVSIPSYYQIDEKLSEDLNKIILELDLELNFDVGDDGIEQISFAVIDLTSDQPKLGGVNYDNFIYPASVYKMYVAAEILNQVSQKKYSLYQSYVAKEPNVVDRSKQIDIDPRPLLKDGDTVTVNYLLDLMITRSDNSAANCLIDIAQRKNIDSLLHNYNWFGSEVTRKFLKRKYEDPGYESIRGTETCALHAADFMYKVYSNSLVNEWVSLQMKTLLGRQLDTSKLSTGLPACAMFYHKTGWFAYWTNDVGIVIDGDVKYIIACFIPLEEDLAQPKFKLLSEKVYELIKSRK
ncbi:MAG: serine hydrolase [Ignavibacteriaceae bacterium]|nr:serine hydrolase [Ignavibacterium sp.]MCC6254251.1 serine hydrolase [Ignavibacteriaceae bacterium]HRN27758.1 class A beta-lactamase-related serine hydrolase [Ignavibacteriaceae bacterium]HRP91972.1 class A beta-lactamase-related serine hydrolase [Ignavibacteriaceae bacterium]HRQ55439.1 class A beta-lactamase-related serine hydrolase [Ignavibacteriaceae bacterium]